jgi:hypothetical protein
MRVLLCAWGVSRVEHLHICLCVAFFFKKKDVLASSVQKSVYNFLEIFYILMIIIFKW